MYSPLFSKEESQSFLLQYNLVPVAKQFSLNFDTSLSVFIKTGSQFLLESAESGDAMGRYSFIGRGIQRKFVLHENSVVDWKKSTGDDQLIQERHEGLDNPLTYVQDEMRAYRVPKDELYRFPPFWGGLLGYLGYETVGYFEDIAELESKEGIDIPHGILVIPTQLMVVDHFARMLWIVETIADVSQYDTAVSSIDACWERINQDMPEYATAYNDISNSVVSDELDSHVIWHSSLNEEEFIKKVEYCKECIYKGDVIQVVFSRQVTTSFESDHELLLYMRLRNINPSPYMYYLCFDDFSIIGSSPETMVSLSADGTMQVRPIAGTIKRGRTQEEDEKNRKILLNDEKERAEHIMLVDLGRNDLHRIAKPGTVHVPQSIYLEGYSHVYHIVSTVEGRINDGLDGFDLIRATFPAGTLSGAPKIEAMNIIGRTEPQKRNAYAGLVMAMGFNGYLDSCIVIRTAVVKDNTIHLQAGAGIVADSEPEKEWKETELKLGALTQTVEIVQTQGRLARLAHENDQKHDQQKDTP